MWIEPLGYTEKVVLATGSRALTEKPSTEASGKYNKHNSTLSPSKP